MTLRARLSRYLSPPLFPVRLRDLPCRLTLHDVPARHVRGRPGSRVTARPGLPSRPDRRLPHRGRRARRSPTCPTTSRRSACRSFPGAPRVDLGLRPGRRRRPPHPRHAVHRRRVPEPRRLGPQHDRPTRSPSPLRWAPGPSCPSTTTPPTTTPPSTCSTWRRPPRWRGSATSSRRGKETRSSFGLPTWLDDQRWRTPGSTARACSRPRTSRSPTSPSTSSEPDTVVWVDFCGPTKEQLHELADELGLHELAVEDALEPAPATEARPLRHPPVPVVPRRPGRTPTRASSTRPRSTPSSTTAG